MNTVRTPRAAAVILAVVLTALPSAVLASGSARSAGMAGTVTAVTTGIEGAEANPANLAWRDNPGVGIELISTQFLLSNNGIDLSLYNASMNTHLEDDDKQNILSSIPATGLTADAHLGASALGVMVGKVAVTFGGRADASTNLPHDVFELLLMGNAEADSLNFSDAKAEAISVASAKVSTAITVGHTRWGPIYAGFGLAYLQGVGYAHLEEIDGELVTNLQGIHGQATGQLKTATLGAGFGLDLGLATELGPWYRASLAVRNAWAQVQYTEGIEIQTFVATLDTLDLETIENSDDENDLFDSTDATFTGDPFTVTLPRVLNLGLSRVTDGLTLGLEYEQGFETRAGSTTTPRIALGSEWRALGWLPLRAGLSLGGRSRQRASAGFGLHLFGFRMDFAASTIGELWPSSPRGVAVAVGTGLRF